MSLIESSDNSFDPITWWKWLEKVQFSSSDQIINKNAALFVAAAVYFAPDLTGLSSLIDANMSIRS